MIDLRLTEAEYGQMSIKQRARLIAARKLPDMVASLNTNREYERIRRQQHGKA